jgi:hypothetical protein
MGKTGDVSLFSLKDREKICNTCGGILRPLSPEEKSRINLRMDFPRGVFICDDCKSLASISVRPIGIGFDEEGEHDVWTEFIEGIGETMLLTEKEAAEDIVKKFASIPIEAESYQIQIGTMFVCKGKGPSCVLYKYASSGVGSDIACGGKDCRFDPYPEQYKMKYWFKKDSSWNSPYGGEVVYHWIDVLKGRNREKRLDALRRLGSIDIQLTRDVLYGSVFFDKDVEIQKIALAHLANRRVTEQVKLAFLHCLEKGEREIKVTAAKLIREMPWSDKDIIKQMAYLTNTNREELRREAVITLRFLQRKLK